MDPIDGLQKAWDQGSDLLAGFRPEDLDASTPCVGCDVRTVVNHVLGEALMMTDANRGVAGSNERGDLIGEGNAASTWQTIGRENVSLVAPGTGSRGRSVVCLWHVSGHGSASSSTWARCSCTPGICATSHRAGLRPRPRIVGERFRALPRDAARAPPGRRRVRR